MRFIVNVLFWLILTIIRTLFAKEYECKFTNALSENFVSCELRNVKYDGKDSFDLIVNETEVEAAARDDDPDDYLEHGNIDVYVVRLRFKWSKLATVPNTIFLALPKLEIFDGSNIELHYINSLSFNGAEDLVKILLNNNRLTSINSYCFVHTKKLETLDLSNNKISNVQRYAFNALTNLKVLGLSNNYISTLDDATFRPLTHIEWIWLDRNRLTMITSDLFSRVNELLEGIYLNNNNINLISPQVFDNLPKLRFLIINGNKCINRSFKNHVIQENAAIKMELRWCFKEYRKIIDEEDKHNVTLSLQRSLRATETCLKEIMTLSDTLNSTIIEVTEMEKQGIEADSAITETYEGSDVE